MKNLSDNKRVSTYSESTTTPKIRFEQEPEKKAPTTTTPKVKPKPDAKSD